MKSILKTLLFTAAIGLSVSATAGVVEVDEPVLNQVVVPPAGISGGITNPTGANVYVPTSTPGGTIKGGYFDLKSSLEMPTTTFAIAGYFCDSNAFYNAGTIMPATNTVCGGTLTLNVGLAPSLRFLGNGYTNAPAVAITGTALAVSNSQTILFTTATTNFLNMPYGKFTGLQSAVGTNGFFIQSIDLVGFQNKIIP